VRCPCHTAPVWAACAFVRAYSARTHVCVCVCVCGLARTLEFDSDVCAIYAIYICIYTYIHTYIPKPPPPHRSTTRPSLSFCRSLALPATHTAHAVHPARTHAHTQTRAHTHANPHTPKHVRTHTQTHTHPNTRAHKPGADLRPTCTHARAPTQVDESDGAKQIKHAVFQWPKPAPVPSRSPGFAALNQFARACGTPPPPAPVAKQLSKADATRATEGLTLPYKTLRDVLTAVADFEVHRRRQFAGTLTLSDSASFFLLENHGPNVARYALPDQVTESPS
jgi:hypothetical protein